MIDRGWLKLHRSLLDWEWYSDMNVRVLFLHLLLKANHRPSRYQGHAVPAGSLVSGRKVLAEETGLSEKQVRTALDKLKKSGEIGQRALSRFSILTIVKWAEYQTEPRARATPTVPDRSAIGPAPGHPPATSKEGKKEIREDSKEVRSLQSSSLQSSSLSSSSSTDDKAGTKKTRARLEDFPPDFQALWTTYDVPPVRKGSISACFKVWKKALGTGVDPGFLVRQAGLYIQTKQGSGPYAKGLSPWLNQQCWEIDFEADIQFHGPAEVRKRSHGKSDYTPNRTHVTDQTREGEQRNDRSRPHGLGDALAERLRRNAGQTETLAEGPAPILDLSAEAAG